MEQSRNRNAGREDERPIFLVGFMGAGKTTVGQVLAKRLEYDFYDLDSVIENRAGRTVQQIFANQGERTFRQLERQAIASCREMKNTVIALGGGAFVLEGNRKALGEIGITVWLDCPLETCLERVGKDKSRPLLGSAQEMRALLDSRRPAYMLADYVAQTERLTPDEIAIEIIRMLKR